ncbi:Hypothetical predicted protein [Mytilus galloprovincialis]|uniref:Uncharacterized protein n=1 Tax=Mytilus galloprovincialis TaxID=29158 RepID=A0A8B6D294_MYTGA|nr:Hypothetical predicted protein [Mytilus galloprovincialis]
MKRLFGARESWLLGNSKDEVKEHQRKTQSDERREEDLEECKVRDETFELAQKFYQQRWSKMLWKSLTPVDRKPPYKYKAAGIGRFGCKENRPQCLPGRYKAWMYQHGCLAKKHYVVLVYEFPCPKLKC